MAMANNFNKKNTVNNGKMKTFSSQDSKLQEITNARMKRVLLNNKYFQLDYESLENFLNSKIDFGKYKQGTLQGFITKESLQGVYNSLNDIKNLSTFDGKLKLGDIYDFSGKLIKLKEEWKDFKRKNEVTEIVKGIFNNKNLEIVKKYPELKNVFITKDEGFTWFEVLKNDSSYINKLIDLYDFSDPEKSYGLFTYYTNKTNINLYINGALQEDDIEEFQKNKLSSFEIDIQKASFEEFKEKFKDKGLYFIDVETTGLNYKVGSLLSFGFVKLEYDKKTNSFVRTEKGEYFIKDIKEPITDLSAHGGAFGKYQGNKITQELMDQKGLEADKASEKIRKILENNNVLAHNASFDMEVLNLFYTDLKNEVPLANKFYDTYADVFPFYFKNIGEYKTLSALGLDALAKKILEVDISNETERHTALKDAEWSADILLKLVNHKDIVNNVGKKIDDKYNFNPNDLYLN